MGSISLQIGRILARQLGQQIAVPDVAVQSAEPPLSMAALLGGADDEGQTAEVQAAQPQDGQPPQTAAAPPQEEGWFTRNTRGLGKALAAAYNSNPFIAASPSNVGIAALRSLEKADIPLLSYIAKLDRNAAQSIKEWQDELAPQAALFARNLIADGAKETLPTLNPYKDMERGLDSAEGIAALAGSMGSQIAATLAGGAGLSAMAARFGIGATSLAESGAVGQALSKLPWLANSTWGNVLATGTAQALGGLAQNLEPYNSGVVSGLTMALEAGADALTGGLSAGSPVGSTFGKIATDAALNTGGAAIANLPGTLIDNVPWVDTGSAEGFMGSYAGKTAMQSIIGTAMPAVTHIGEAITSRRGAGAHLMPEDNAEPAAPQESAPVEVAPTTTAAEQPADIPAPEPFVPKEAPDNEVAWAANWYDANSKEYFSTKAKKTAAAQNLGIEPDAKGNYPRAAFVAKLAELARQPDITHADITARLRGEILPEGEPAAPESAPEPIAGAVEAPPTPDAMPRIDTPETTPEPVAEAVRNPEPITDNPESITHNSQPITQNPQPLESQISTALENSYTKAARAAWNEGDDIVRMGFDIDNADKPWEQLTPEQQQQASLNLTPRKERAKAVEEFTKIARDGQERRAAEPVQAMPQETTAPQPAAIKESLTTEPVLPSAEVKQPTPKKKPAADVTFDEIDDAAKWLSANEGLDARKRLSGLQKALKVNYDKAVTLIERVAARGDAAEVRPAAEPETQATPQETAAQRMSGTEWEQARQRGYYEQNGHRIERQPDVSATGKAKLSGEADDIAFDKKTSIKGQWALMDAEDLQPSHIAGRQNPLHFMPEAQPKDRNLTTAKGSAAVSSQIGELRPAEILVAPDAFHGAPVINERGEVIQGNGRAARILNYWQQHPDDPRGLREFYKNKRNAAFHGFAPEDIDAVKNPVIVRMARGIDDAEAIRLGNIDDKEMTDTGGVKDAERAYARSISPDAKEKLAKKLRDIMMNETGDTSFAEMMASHGDSIRKILAEGKSDAADAYAKFSDPETIKNTLADLVIERAGPAETAVFNATGEKRLMSDITRDGVIESLPAFYADDGTLKQTLLDALALHAKYSPHAANMSMEDYITQQGLFGGGDKPTAKAVAMHQMLANAPRKETIKKFFRDYLQGFGAERPQADAFGFDEPDARTDDPFLGALQNAAKAFDNKNFAKVPGRSDMERGIRRALALYTSGALQSSPAAAMGAAALAVPDDDEESWIPGVSNSSLKKFLTAGTVAGLGAMMTLRSGMRSGARGAEDIADARKAVINQWHKASGYSDAKLMETMVQPADAAKLALMARLHGAEAELIKLGQSYNSAGADLAPEDALRLGARELLRDKMRLSRDENAEVNQTPITGKLSNLADRVLDEGPANRLIARRGLDAVHEALAPEIAKRTYETETGEQGANVLAYDTERQMRALFTEGQLGGKPTPEQLDRLTGKIFGNDFLYPRGGESPADYVSAARNAAAEAGFGDERLTLKQVYSGGRETINIGKDVPPLEYNRTGLNDLPEFASANSKIRKKIEADLSARAKANGGTLTAADLRESLELLDHAVQIGDEWKGKFLRAAIGLDPEAMKAGIDEAGGELPLFGGELIIRKHRPAGSDRANYAITMGERMRAALRNEYQRGYLNQSMKRSERVREVFDALFADNPDIDATVASTKAQRIVAAEESAADFKDDFEEYAGKSRAVTDAFNEYGNKVGAESYLSDGGQTELRAVKGEDKTKVEEGRIGEDFLGRSGELPSEARLAMRTRKGLKTISNQLLGEGKSTATPEERESLAKEKRKLIETISQTVRAYAADPTSPEMQNAIDMLARRIGFAGNKDVDGIALVDMFTQVIDDHVQFQQKLRELDRAIRQPLPEGLADVLRPVPPSASPQSKRLARPVSRRTAGLFDDIPDEPAKQSAYITEFDKKFEELRKKSKPAAKSGKKPPASDTGRLFMHPSFVTGPISIAFASTLDDDEEYFGIKGSVLKAMIVAGGTMAGMRSVRRVAGKAVTGFIGMMGNANAKYRLQNVYGGAAREVMDAKIAALRSAGIKEGSPEWGKAIKAAGLEMKNGKVTQNAASLIAERMRQDGYDQAKNPQEFDTELQARLKEYNDIAKGAGRIAKALFGVEYFNRIDNPVARRIGDAVLTAEQWTRGKSREAEKLHNVFTSNNIKGVSAAQHNALRQKVGAASVEMDNRMTDLRSSVEKKRRAAVEAAKSSLADNPKALGAELRKIAGQAKAERAKLPAQINALREEILTRHFGNDANGRQKWDEWQKAMSAARQIDIDRMIQKSMGIHPWEYKEKAQGIKDNVAMLTEQRKTLVEQAQYITDPEDFAAMQHLMETNGTSLFYARRQAAMLEYFDKLRADTDTYHYALRWHDKPGEHILNVRNSKGQTVKRVVAKNEAEANALYRELLAEGNAPESIERLVQRRADNLTQSISRKGIDTLIRRMFQTSAGAKKLSVGEAATLLRNTPEFAALPQELRQQVTSAISGQTMTPEKMRYVLMGMWTRPLPNMLNRKNIAGYEPVKGKELQWALGGFDRLLNRARESVEAQTIVHAALDERQNMINKGFDDNPFMGYLDKFIKRAQGDPYEGLSSQEVALGKKLQRAAGFSALAVNSTHFIKNIMFGTAATLGELTSQSKGGFISQTARGAGRLAKAAAATTFYKSLGRTLESNTNYGRLWKELADLDIGETQYLRNLMEQDIARTKVGKTLMVFSRSSERLNNQISAMAAGTRVLDMGGSMDEAIKAGLGLRAATQGRFSAWSAGDAEAKIRRMPGGVGIAAMALYSASFRASEHFASLVYRGLRSDNPKASGMVAAALALTAIGGLTNVPLVADAVQLWEWIENLTGDRNEDRTVSEGATEKLRRKTGELAKRMGADRATGEFFYDLMYQGALSMATNRNFTSDASMIGMADPIVLSKIGNIGRTIMNFANSNNTAAEDFFTLASTLNTTAGRVSRAAWQAAQNSTLDSRGNYTGRDYGALDVVKESLFGREFSDALASRERFKKSGGIYDAQDAADYIKSAMRLPGLKVQGEGSAAFRKTLAGNAADIRRGVLERYESTGAQRSKDEEAVQEYIADNKKKLDAFLLDGGEVRGNTKKPARLASALNAAVKDYYTGMAIESELRQRGVSATYENRGMGGVNYAKKKLAEMLQRESVKRRR